MVSSAASPNSEISSTTTSGSDQSIFTNYVNASLSIDKLDDTNYWTCALGIKLWFESQGYLDYLTQKMTYIPTDDFPVEKELMLIYAWFSRLQFNLLYNKLAPHAS